MQSIDSFAIHPALRVLLDALERREKADGPFDGPLAGALRAWANAGRPTVPDLRWIVGVPPVGVIDAHAAGPHALQIQLGQHRVIDGALAHVGPWMVGIPPTHSPMTPHLPEVVWMCTRNQVVFGVVRHPYTKATNVFELSSVRDLFHDAADLAFTPLDGNGFPVPVPAARHLDQVHQACSAFLRWFASTVGRTMSEDEAVAELDRLRRVLVSPPVSKGPVSKGDDK